MLIGDNLIKEVNGCQILGGVNVAVRPGQATVVVGPNGAGKSVLLRALALVEPPTSGRITFGSTTYKFPEANAFTSRSQWPEVSVVFQQLFLWPHLTLRENILLPLRKHRANSKRHEEFERLVKKFRLDGVIERYPNQASIGERQRTALVRALVLQPRYLLLDEVTSAQDVEQVQILLNHLQDLKREGVGLLIITHLLGFGGRLADEVLFLKDGKLVESGAANILTAPQTKEMSQFVSLVEFLREDA